MKILFSEDKKHILFLHQTPQEYKALGKFPAFVHKSIYFACDACKPVAFNVVNRVFAKFKNVVVSEEVNAWLNTPFKLAPIPEWFKYHTRPKDFQEIALRYLHTLGSAGVLLDPGMGKSKVVLDYIFLRGFKKSIIVCPKALLFVWEDEIEKHRPELSFYTVQSTDWEAERAGILAAQVVIINYNKATLFKFQLKSIQAEFLHLDEFLIKDPSTERTKSLTELSKAIPFKAGGSGTLVNNTPLDIFSPVRFLQPSLVGFSYTNFKNRYSVQKDVKDRGSKIVVGYRDLPEVKAILESCSIVMTKEQWLKLPDKKFIDIRVQMREDQKTAYYGLLSNRRLAVDNFEIRADNPLVALAKLYQISNGFIYLNEGDDEDPSIRDLLPEETSGEKRKKPKKRIGTFFFEDQPKLDALRKLITQTLPSGRRGMIWFNMEAEYELISSLLTELGETFLVIKGGEKNTGTKVRSFNKDPSIRWLLCQAKSVNYGITVMGSKPEDLDKESAEVIPDLDSSVFTQIFYSLNFSLEVYLQQQDRTHRIGQEHECEYYRLFCNSPVETRIFQIISEKMSLKKEMLVDVAESIFSNPELIQEEPALN